jgi:hypothetical protein
VPHYASSGHVAQTYAGPGAGPARPLAGGVGRPYTGRR